MTPVTGQESSFKDRRLCQNARCHMNKKRIFFRSAEHCHKTSQVPVTLVTGQESSFKDTETCPACQMSREKECAFFYGPAFIQFQMTPVTGQESSVQRQQILYLNVKRAQDRRVRYFPGLRLILCIWPQDRFHSKRARAFFRDSLMDRISIWEQT